MPTFANNSSVYFAMSTDALVQCELYRVREKETGWIDFIIKKNRNFLSKRYLRSYNKRSVSTLLTIIIVHDEMFLYLKDIFYMHVISLYYNIYIYQKTIVLLHFRIVSL